MKRKISCSTVILSLMFSTSLWSACPQSPESNVQLQILGSGGPGAAGGRASAAYLLWIDGVGRIMVDAGSGTKDQFYQSGASLNDIDILALSHLHPDHSAELPALLWPAGGAFRVSGPSAAGVFPSIEEFLDRLFGPQGAFYVLEDRIELDAVTVDVTSTDPIEVWRDEDAVIRGRGVPHGDVPTIGYRVDLGDRSIAFASDQNGSDPTFADFISDVDVLVIHMAGTEESTGIIAELHAKPSVWGQMATAANVGQVVVSHISNALAANDPSSRQVLNTSMEILRDNYSGPLTLGEDLMCIEVK